MKSQPICGTIRSGDAFMTETNQLSPQLQGILDFIQEYIQRQGYAPSVREIGSAIGIASTSTVHALLKRLEEGAYLRRDPSIPRAMVVQHKPSEKPPGVNLPEASVEALTEDSEQPLIQALMQTLPFVELADIHGAFAAENGSQAGPAPSPTPERHAGTEAPAQAQAAAQHWTIPEDLLPGGAHFITRMPDDSMTNRQLSAGDFLIVRKQNTANNSDIAVVRMFDETLIRSYYKGLRQVRLQAEHNDHETMLVNDEELAVYGVVVGFVHTF